MINDNDDESRSITEARRALDQGKPSVIYRRLVADLDTPVSAYLKLSKGERYSCLLESVEGGDIRGRYSIIGVAPDQIFEIKGHEAFTSTDGGMLEKHSGKPIEVLRKILIENHIDLPDFLPSMSAGFIGYMGYDMVRQMEDLPAEKKDPINIPTARFMRPTIMAVFDGVTNLITLVTPVRPDPVQSVDLLIQSACERLDQMMDRLSGSLPSKASLSSTPLLEPETLKTNQSSDHQSPDNKSSQNSPPITSNTSKQRYKEMVRKAQDYILSGDIFQVVLSQRFSIPFTLPPFALYRSLRRTNPSPFLYHLDFDGTAIVGSSPEILVRVRDKKVTIRPIAGTRKRGDDEHQDKLLEQDLLADPKECAEHLMLLDLGRNDVGRVAKPGTVNVTARNTIERYSHVMHIVSNVEGCLADDKDLIDALSAGFPAGTVSGAPKIRAMEIIDELESEGRSAYAGSVGYFSACGDMDTAIVLRTAIIKQGMMYVQAGAGIVADSIPDDEQKECEAKASALFHAAEDAIFIAQSNH